MPPPLLPPTGCNLTSRMPAATVSSPSTATPPDTGNLLGPGPCGEGGNNPCLCNKEKHRLNNSFEEKSRNPRTPPLSAEYPCHPPPHRPGLHQIPDHSWSILIPRRYHSPQVSERGHHTKGASIRTECPWGDWTFLLHCQAPSLPLRPLLALRCAPVHSVQEPPRHQYVEHRAP